MGAGGKRQPASTGVGEVPVFPRRGKEVRLRLLSGEKLVAEFTIPNPRAWVRTRFGPRNTLPVHETSGDLEVTLAGFRVFSLSTKTCRRRELSVYSISASKIKRVLTGGQLLWKSQMRRETIGEPFQMARRWKMGTFTLGSRVLFGRANRRGNSVGNSGGYLGFQRMKQTADRQDSDSRWHTTPYMNSQLRCYVQRRRRRSCGCNWGSRRAGVFVHGTQTSGECGAREGVRYGSLGW